MRELFPLTFMQNAHNQPVLTNRNTKAIPSTSDPVAQKHQPATTPTSLQVLVIDERSITYSLSGYLAELGGS